MTAARHGQRPNGRHKRSCRRIEKFRTALRITAGDENMAVVKQRSSMTRPRCAHALKRPSGNRAGMRGIKNFRGRQRSACAGAACDQHAAVSQNCRAVIDARGVQRGACAGGLRFRIENFRGGDEVAVGCRVRR